MYRKSASACRPSQQYSPREYAAQCTGGGAVAHNRPEWRPHTSITYGTYYPGHGYGNNTGVFNIVGGPQQSYMSPRRPAVFRENTEPIMRMAPVYNITPPVNRSGVFAVAGLPSEAHARFSQPQIETNLYAVKSGKSPRCASRNAVAKSAAGKSPRCESAHTRRCSTASHRMKFSSNMQAEECNVQKQKVVEKVVEKEREVVVENEIRDEIISNRCPQMHYANEETCEPCPSPCPKTSYAYFYAAYPMNGYRNVAARKNCPNERRYHDDSRYLIR